MRRLVAGLVGGVVLLGAACGNSQTPEEKTLGTVQDRLADVRSGDLAMTLLAASQATPATSGVGFTVAGEFAAPRAKGSLPSTDLRYTRITGKARSTTRFVTTQKHAYAFVDNVAYQLRDQDVTGLRANGGGDTGLAGLDFTRWLRNPKITAGPTLDGVPTQRITGTVDAVGALNDVLGLAHEFGGAAGDYPSAIGDDDAATVRRSVQATEVVVLVGKRDRLLRQFRFAVTMAVSKQDRLRKALRDLAGVRISMDLRVAKVNRPITVSAPAHPRPANELPH